MKRKKPSFDESYYGYRSFTHLLEEADNLALVDIERNPKSGTYVVTRFFGERSTGQKPTVPEKVSLREEVKASRERGAVFRVAAITPASLTTRSMRS